MGAPIHAGIDMDGVVADFNEGFIRFVVQLTRRDLFPPRPFDIPCWDYPQHYGYTEAEVNACWQQIEAGDTFWRCLKPYKGTLEFLTTIDLLGAQLTFVTSRMGKNVVEQTRGWLKEFGISYPDVIISGKKGDAVRRLGITHYIDDKNENCVDASKAGAKVFMLAQPWNIEQPGTLRIPTLGTFLDALAADLKTNRETANAR